MGFLPDVPDVANVLSSGLGGLLLPIAAGIGAARAPRTTHGVMQGLNAFMGMDQFRRLREAEKSQREAVTKLAGLQTEVPVTRRGLDPRTTTFVPSPRGHDQHVDLNDPQEALSPSLSDAGIEEQFTPRTHPLEPGMEHGGGWQDTPMPEGPLPQSQVTESFPGMPQMAPGPQDAAITGQGSALGNQPFSMSPEDTLLRPPERRPMPTYETTEERPVFGPTMRRYLETMAEIDPRAAAMLVGQQLMPKPQRPITVSPRPGSFTSILDPETNEEIRRVEGPPATPAEIARLVRESTPKSVQSWRASRNPQNPAGDLSLLESRTSGTLPPGTGTEVATAMRELGLDPTDPGAYTPTNIRTAQDLINQRKQSILSMPVRDALASAGIDSTAATPSEVADARRQIFSERVQIAAAQGQQAALLKSTEALSKQRANTQRVISGIGSLQDKIQHDPAVLGAPGSLSRAAVSASDQAMALAGLVIPPAELRRFMDAERYVNIFRETGVTSAQLQSQLLGLAVATAAAEGFTGREVTDRKIQLNLQRLAGAVGSGSAHAAFETLEQFKQEIAEGYQTAVSAFQMRDDLTAPLLRERDRRTFAPTQTQRSQTEQPSLPGVERWHRNPRTGQLERAPSQGVPQ